MSLTDDVAGYPLDRNPEFYVSDREWWVGVWHGYARQWNRAEAQYAQAMLDLLDQEVEECGGNLEMGIETEILIYE